VKKSSLVLTVIGVGLLLGIGGFVSIAGNQTSTTAGTSASAVADPSVDSGCLADTTKPGIQDFSSAEESPMVNPCAGVVCHSNSNCQQCCTSGGYTLWRCFKSTHTCVCAN